MVYDRTISFRMTNLEAKFLAQRARKNSRPLSMELRAMLNEQMERAGMSRWPDDRRLAAQREGRTDGL